MFWKERPVSKQEVSAEFGTGAKKQGKEGRPGKHSLGSTGGTDGLGRLQLFGCVSDDHEYWVWQNSKSVELVLSLTLSL